MEVLIDLFFSNPIFTMLLLFGIISYFNRLLSGGKEHETHETSDHHSTNERQTTSRSHQSSQYGRSKPEIEVETITFEQQRERQMEQLAGRMNTTLDVEEELEDTPLYQNLATSSILRDERETQSRKQIEMKKRIHGKLNRDGLVDSVIMAEVLGRPRALSPYRNVLMRRR